MPAIGRSFRFSLTALPFLAAACSSAEVLNDGPGVESTPTAPTTGSTAQSLTQVGVSHADQFTRQTYSTALGTSTYGNTWLENPLNFFPSTNPDSAQFETILETGTSNGRLRVVGLGKSDTTTAHMDVDLNSTPSYTVRFSLNMANVSDGKAGLFVLPRAQGTDVVGNAGWVLREAGVNSANFEVHPFSASTVRSGTPPVVPLPTGTPLATFSKSVPHYVQISVNQNQATLFVDDTRVGTITTNTYAAGTADRVTLGYSAFTSADTALVAFIDDFSVALPVTHASAAVPARFGMNARRDTQDVEWPYMTLGNVKNLRAGYYWSNMEPVRDQYDFFAQKTLAGKIANQGMKQVVLLAYGNSTSNADAGAPYPGDITTPDSRAGYVRWASALVSEYRRTGLNNGVIWEIWNEPNGAFWPTPTSQEYMDLLNAAVPAIKAADPNANVVSGGINVLSSESTLAWLDGCVQRHLLSKVDGLGVHLYDFDAQDDNPATPDGPPKNPYPERIIGELSDVRRRTGQTSLAMYNTEWGVAVNVDKGIIERMKAEALVRMNLLTLMEDLKLNIYFNWRGSPDGGDPKKSVFELDASGKPVVPPKDAYTALTYMNAQLSGYTFQKRLDLGAGINQDVYALLFVNGANRKIALWTHRTTPQPVAIPVTATRNYNAVSMLGVALPALPAEAGRISVEATTSPIYIDLGTDNASDNATFDYRFQLETLTPTSGPSNIRAFTIGEPTVSGGGTQRLQGVSANVWQYATPSTRSVPLNTYYVMMRNVKANNGTTYRLNVAGQDQGTTSLLDSTAINGKIQEPAETGPFRSFGGTAQVPFSFTLTADGVIWNDYIEFVPTVQTYQAENLAQKSDGVTVTRQTEATTPPTVRDVFPATAVGQIISYTVPIPRTRTAANAPAQYTVTVGFKRQAAAGSFRLEVPESTPVAIGTASQAAGTQDFVTFTQKVQFGTTTNVVPAGNKEFKFIVTGANGGSHALTIDYIRLQ
ncbi:MAG TPA: cellulase family glycosylhydrolase [Polyangiaceae bacterium]